MFQDLMAKKVSEWDRMMGTTKDEERGLSFEHFRKLSDEEVDLARRTVSKNRLKEFIDLKIQYFDQLAGEATPKHRAEGLKKFRQVCESELELAKAVGPQHVFLEEAEAEAALAKKKRAEEDEKKEEEEKKKKKKEEEEKKSKEEEDKKAKEEEEKKKKKKEEEEKAAKEAQNQRDVQAQAMYGMQAMMPRMMPGMRPRGLPLAMTPEQMRALMMASGGQAASTSRMFSPSGTQGMQDLMGTMPQGSHIGSEHKPLTAEEMTALYDADGTMKFTKAPGQYPSRLPSKSSMADVRGTDKEKDSKVSDIDQKLKLLTQLESARGVLQNHYPPDSSTSMADEVRNRLRKINRLQMKVIDEILGSKADLTSEIVSDLRPEKHDREKVDDLTTDAKKGKKGKKEPKKIIVELPDYSEADTHVVTASISRFDAQGMCTGTTDLCPLPEESRPEVLWERPPDRRSMGGPPGDDYGPPPDMGQRCIHYERHIDFFPDNAPHYHEEMPPPPPEDVYYPQPAFSTPTYSVLQSQCFTPPPCLPLEFDIIAQGNFSFAPEAIDVGVEAEDLFPEDLYDDDDDNEEAPLPPPSSKPQMVSKTTIIVNRPEQGVETEIVQPAEQSQMQGQEASVQPPQPLQMAAIQTAAASEPRPTPSPQIHVQTVEVKQSSSSDTRFAKSCEESLQRIANSVDDILNSLSSLSSEYAQGAGRRQGRYDDDYYDDDASYDEYDDYSESDDPPPRRQRRRSKSSGRRRTSAGNKESPSLWGWLCRSVRTIREGSPSRANQNDSQIVQVANRIRELVQRVIQASNEVIMARKAIQQGGLQGQIAMQNVFEAENKLWQLINLEGQLANELAQYRTLDTTSDKAYFDSLIQAEDKIRRLIQVETQLANEIGAWRQMSQQMPQATSYTRTTMYKAPGNVYSTSTSATPTGLLSPSSSSTGYTS